MNYSRNEFIDMIFVLGEANKNCLLAQRLYREKYPQRRTPDSRSFRVVMDRFMTTGSVDLPKRNVANRVANEGKELEILLQIEEDPHIGSRRLALLSNVSQTTVNRTTRKYKYHPYHIELHQELHNQDFQLRVTFCEWLLRKIEINPNFVNYIMYSDEATFKSNGAVNRHNMHYYATENPHWVREVQHQNHWSLNVWCGIHNNRIIGPYFFNEPLNGHSYRVFLQQQLPELLEEVNLQERQSMWFQQDGAPPHFHRAVREYLDQEYPQRWIGRGGFVAWPPRSCDLTPLDFFLWGYLKDKVYATKPTTREDMIIRIRDACQTVTPGMLYHVRQNIIKRINICIEQGGHIFEHLLNRN